MNAGDILICKKEYGGIYKFVHLGEKLKLLSINKENNEDVFTIEVDRTCSITLNKRYLDEYFIHNHDRRKSIINELL